MPYNFSATISWGNSYYSRTHIPVRYINIKVVNHYNMLQILTGIT